MDLRLVRYNIEYQEQPGLPGELGDLAFDRLTEQYIFLFRYGCDRISRFAIVPREWGELHEP